jgi:hypothetical protein
MKPRDNGKDRADGVAPQVPLPEESRSLAGNSRVVRSRPNEDAAPLGRRPASGLDQTLPLGTPRPAPVQPSGGAFDRAPDRVRSAYKQTILLGTREHPLGLREPAFGGPWGPPTGGEAPVLSESPAPVTSSVPPASGPLADAEPGASTLRGSFVRVVGPPTVPPPRRSRRSGVAWEPAWAGPAPEHSAADRSLAADSDQHEAFALDRPVSNPTEELARTSTAESVVVSRGSGPEGVQAARSGSVMLPPPPGVGDYEPASGPDSAPPPLQAPSASLVALAGPAAVPPTSTRSALQRPPPLAELPSVNPFAGFEAPRESWGRRSAIVFTMALALVGLCALVAIALGFLGKRGW